MAVYKSKYTGTEIDNSIGAVQDTNNISVDGQGNVTSTIKPTALPFASSSAKGGVIALPKESNYTQEVKIDTTTGRLYVPPSSGGGGSGLQNIKFTVGNIKSLTSTEKSTILEQMSILYNTYGIDIYNQVSSLMFYETSTKTTYVCIFVEVPSENLIHINLLNYLNISYATELTTYKIYMNLSLSSVNVNSYTYSLVPKQSNVLSSRSSQALSSNIYYIFEPRNSNITLTENQLYLTGYMNVYGGEIHTTSQINVTFPSNIQWIYKSNSDISFSGNVATLGSSGTNSVFIVNWFNGFGTIVKYNEPTS